MSSRAWAERVLQLLQRMNNFYSTGSLLPQCVKFELDGVHVGWIPPLVLPHIQAFSDVFRLTPGGAVSLSPRLNSYDERSEAVEAVLQTLRARQSFSVLDGWRSEKYSVMPRFSDPPLMCMERSATSLFGVKRYGVHVNAFTLGPDGEMKMWLSRRSKTKQTYPGLLDNLAAGGLAAGVGVKETAVKECEEEASVPPSLADRAVSASTVSYTYEEADGVFPECQFVFDLELPLDFVPKIGDGEVQDFYHLPMSEVQELVASDDFKPNSAMVVLDFLIRHSFIQPDTEPFYQEFVSGLHRPL